MKIKRPNSTPQTDIFWVLNLACLKHTGNTLPQDLLPANTWKYENADGKPKAKLFIPRLSPCFFNDITLQIKRKLVVDELKTIIDYNQKKKDYKLGMDNFQAVLRNNDCVWSGGSIKPEYFDYELIRKLERAHFFQIRRGYYAESRDITRALEVFAYHLITKGVIGHELIRFINNLEDFFNEKPPEEPEAVFYRRQTGTIYACMTYIYKRERCLNEKLAYNLRSTYRQFRWGVSMPKEYSIAEGWETPRTLKYTEHYPKGIWFHKNRDSPTFYKKKNKYLGNSNEYEYFKYVFCGLAKNDIEKPRWQDDGYFAGFDYPVSENERVKDLWQRFKGSNPLTPQETMRIFAGVRTTTLPWEEGSVVQVC